MPTLLEMRAITKTFPGVKALDNVTLSVEQGEIHAICGENGAGKSTLMKVLSGVYPHGSYEGEIIYDGAPLHLKGIRDSEAKGIIIIHQELALVPKLSIAENMFLGNEIAHRGVMNWPKAFQQTEGWLKKVGLSEPPGTLVGKLGVGKQQLIEIAKALAKDVRLLILDEPTAALQENDSEKLLDLMLELKSQGVTQIIISHKLNEIAKVADRITVIRDGTAVSTIDAHEISEDRIIRDMVGRDMAHRYPERVPNPGETLMEVSNWSVWHPEQTGRQVIKNVSLTVRKGEIVGIAGLMGTGRTELAMSIFGKSYGKGHEGTVKMNGKTVDVSTVTRAINAGISYVTEDRKALGLILEEPIVRNTTLANLQGVSLRGILDKRRESRVAEDYRKQLAIRTPGVQQKVVNLSGGNQQKVVLSKWLFTNPQVLILDEPTRGIDVGAKFEIYTIMKELAEQGRSIVMISSEMPELLGMCDRIYVMNEGRIVGELSREEASQEKIMGMILKGEGEGCVMADISVEKNVVTEKKDIGSLLGGRLRENGMLMALVAIVAFFTIMLNLDGKSFLVPANITNIFLQNGHIIILALGMLLVIVSGHIDLSVGSVAAFTGAVSAYLSVNVGLPFYLVIPLGLIVGGLIGAAQGYWVAYWRIPSFIVTLAGMMVFRGATLWLLGGQNIGPFSPEFQALANGFVPDLFGVGKPNVFALVVIAVAIAVQFWIGYRARARDAEFGLAAEPMALFLGRTIIIAAGTGFVGYQLAYFRGLPDVLVVLTVLTVLYGFFTENTTTGRRIYAVGGNEKAAKLSGIRTDRLVFLCFVNMGVLAALAGMEVTARLNSATPKAGTGFELDAIASVFIGGASMTGGSGKIVGVVIGALIMGVMNMGMSIMGIGIEYQQMIKGLVLLIAVIFDVYNKSK